MEGEKGKEEECFVFYVSHVFFFTAEVTASSIQRLLLSRRWRGDMVHFATWRPTASLLQPIRGWETQHPASLLVHCSQELIPLWVSISLCRLALLTPIMPPPLFVQTSFLLQTPLHTYKNTHRLNRTSQHTEGSWGKKKQRHEPHSNEFLYFISFITNHVKAANINIFTQFVHPGKTTSQMYSQKIVTDTWY